MRKSFSGDRDAAFEYVGAAQTQLMILKNMMQLGGLQQLMRKVEYPGGVIVEVAVVFGQEYVSIYAPPAGSAPEETQRAETQEQEQEIVENVSEPERINEFVEKTFSDTVHATGSGSMVWTRPQPSVRRVMAVGTKGDGAFRRNQDGSITTLRSGSGVTGRAISPDGARCAGIFAGAGGTTAAKLYVWESPGSTPLVRALLWNSTYYYGMQFSDDGRFVMVRATTQWQEYEWDRNYLRTDEEFGDYSSRSGPSDPNRGWGNVQPDSGNTTVASKFGTDPMVLPSNHFVQQKSADYSAVVQLVAVAPTVSTIIFTG